MKAPETHVVKQSSRPAGPLAMVGVLALVVIALVAGLYLAPAADVATGTRRIQDLQAQRARVQRENAELMNQIAVEGSIPRLQERAAKMGFAPATQVEYLTVTAVPPDSAPGMQNWATNR